MNKKYYHYTETVKSYQIDFKKTLRLSSLFSMMQEAAYHHAEILGVGVSDLDKAEYLWVLSRVIIKVDRYPDWNEIIEIKTWPKGIKGLFALRDFKISDQQNNIIAKATTGWLIIDSKSRRPIRAIDAVKAIETADESAIDEFPDKLPVCDDTTNRNFYADYSTIDSNKHVNNTKYVDWITDSIRKERLEKENIKKLQINFNSEMHWGDTLQLCYKDENNNRILFTGKNLSKENTAFQGFIEI